MFGLSEKGFKKKLSWPLCHSQMPSAAVESVSEVLTIKLHVCSNVAKRICACTVTINSSIDCLA